MIRRYFCMYFKSFCLFVFGIYVPMCASYLVYRYADIMVHRLLAVCVGHDTTYRELFDIRKAQKICNNLNYRNRMAQYAGRASVALHTHVSIL